jgi:3',5'-cyclic-AMP phosphodiesterase
MTVRNASRTIACFVVVICCALSFAYAADRNYQHIVVLGDPHLPGTTLEEKEGARDTINKWADVDLVVAVGDITETAGTGDEYRIAKKYFSGFSRPLAIIGGNHDYIYADTLSKLGKRLKGKERSRTAKLNLLKETFGLDEVYYTRVMGPYLLVFLTPDDLQAGLLATLSTKQYKWLSEVLGDNRSRPTIIFFHAPLYGTLEQYNEYVNTESYVAQPKEEIRRILADNPQVFMWVSGHTHTSPGRPGFASDINLYEKRVMNIHTTDMKRNYIYTNSLFLFPDKVVVKTFDHHKGVWMNSLERRVPLPGKPE